MKNEKLLYAIGNIEDELILGACKRPKIKRTWIKWGSMAACLCMLLAATALLGPAFAPAKSPAVSGESRITVIDEGVKIPKMRIELPADSAADMIGFFIYQGRCYVDYTTIPSAPGLAGSYLGTATGSIDEWSTADEYVEFSGSIAGDFYEVTGYDPAFMLCMKANDTLRLYINDNGITLKNGRDLFEDRLHLAGRYDLVQYQTREDWFYDMGNINALESGSEEALSDFIKALDDAPFMWIEDIPLPEGAVSVYDDLEIYHMFFQMEDGITVHLRLFEGGYVQFAGILGVCVQVPEECMNRMVGEF